jgi:formylglycine-generating enzyme required for sulfatase activity
MKNIFALAASAATLGFAGSLSASTVYWQDVNWATVGDAGNAPDTTGFGAVANQFRIMNFEFTNRDYAAFLNAVDQGGTNTLKLYNASMTSDGRGGINYVAGNPSGSKYVVKTDFGTKPVNFIDWFDAARVANFMHNGASVGASTEIGAYTLGGATSGSTVARNDDALFWIPTQDEWYKTAYYKGGGTNAGYWEYATQSETAPATGAATATGDGTAGGVGNVANFKNGSDWNSMDGNVTSIGTNGGPSAYGVYDMNGNVREVVEGSPSTTVLYRGGSYTGSAANISATSGFISIASNSASTHHGFRLATNVPEPGSTLPILTLFGLALSKSRRRKA